LVQILIFKVDDGAHCLQMANTMCIAHSQNLKKKIPNSRKPRMLLIIFKWPIPYVSSLNKNLKINKRDQHGEHKARWIQRHILQNDGQVLHKNTVSHPEICISECEPYFNNKYKIFKDFISFILNFCFYLVFKLSS
jgi:hypothetical protein